MQSEGTTITAPPMGELDLESISARYFEAWGARDPQAIGVLHTPDTHFQVHTGGEPAVGREAATAAFAGLFEQLPEFGFEVERTLLGERHWVLDWVLTATLPGADGVAETLVRLDCVDVVEVAPDGLVARKDTWINSADLAALAERAA